MIDDVIKLHQKGYTKTIVSICDCDSKNKRFAEPEEDEKRREENKKKNNKHKDFQRWNDT